MCPPGLLTRVEAAPTSLTLLECRVAHAIELLRCASATAFETADALQGPARHLAMASMHLITQAHRLLDQALDQWPLPDPATSAQEGLPT